MNRPNLEALTNFLAGSPEFKDERMDAVMTDIGRLMEYVDQLEAQRDLFGRQAADAERHVIRLHFAVGESYSTEGALLKIQALKDRLAMADEDQQSHTVLSP